MVRLSFDELSSESQKVVKEILDTVTSGSYASVRFRLIQKLIELGFITK